MTSRDETVASASCTKEKGPGEDVFSRPTGFLHYLLYLVQAARIGWPISNAGSAPFRGTNFCGRPPHTSAV